MLIYRFEITYYSIKAAKCHRQEVLPEVDYRESGIQSREIMPSTRDICRVQAIAMVYCAMRSELAGMFTDEGMLR